MIDLRQGDCLKLLKDIPDGSVDMVLCDPPYGTTACKWDTVIPFEPMWEQLVRIVKKNGAMVFTASEPFAAALVMSNPTMFRHEWIYKKRCASNFAQASYAPMKEHESVLVFGRGKVNYYPIKEERNGSGKDRVKYEFSDATRHKTGEFVGDMQGAYNPHADNLRYPSSVQEFNNRSKGDRGFHPTQKPVLLCEYLIKTYTLPGETVLDFTMGSGTTGVACVNTGRRFIGMELDPGYFEIAQQRIDEAAAQKVVNTDGNL